MTNKLCPIPTHSEGGYSTKDECEKEKCAWYIEETGYCAIIYLHTIALELMELRRSDKTGKD